MAAPASEYRAMQWFFTLVGVGAFVPAIRGAQGSLPPMVGIATGVAGMLSLLVGGYFGWKGAQLRIADRARKADAAAMITLAAFLKDKSEAELEAAVAKGGPAGEAAALVLERRRHGLTRPSGTQSIPKA